MRKKLLIKFKQVILACIAISCTINSPKIKYKQTALEVCECVKPSDNNSPLKISIALNDTYCKKTACSCIHDVASREYEELQAKLKSEFNIELNIKYFVELYDMEKAMKAKTYDGVICKPWSAFVLSKEHKIKYKRIADILDPYDNQWLTGTFLVKKESTIKKLEDIEGKTLVAGQNDAYEKYHLPFNLLEKEGIKPGNIINKASCLESINCLLDNKAEVAVVSDYVMSASCAVDIASADDFRVIETTEKIPLCSVILDMDKVKREDALRLQKALLKLSGVNSPKTMLSKGFVKPDNWIPVPFVSETKSM